MALTFAPAAPAVAHEGPSSFADLAQKLLPAVVNISTTQIVTAQDDMGDMPDLQLPPGSPFEEFFKDFMDKYKAQKHKATSLGSGFIIDPAGYIVTNYHVIENADQITVILQDDTNLTATVVGKDKKTDLALLKVNTKKALPSVDWGDSDKIRVGDWILAIGDPYGLGGTVTSGIISARARDINSGPYDEYLQTDAPINRGNSGGPMFNMDGDVVGVNTAIFSPSGGSIGIGFAIPSALAKNIISQLRAHGHIRRGWLGVRIQMVTQDIADSLGLGKATGALVASVNAGGPAAKAGVEPGDVILEFDGKKVQEMHRLPLMVAETPVDKTVDMTVFRKRENVTLQVKIGELKPQVEPSTAADDQGTSPNVVPGEKVDDLGIKVASLTDALRTKYDIKRDVTGVIVTDVSSDGLAANQGIQVGDVISEASQQGLKAPEDLIDQVKSAKKGDKPLLLLINRKDDLEFVAISFPKTAPPKDQKDKKPPTSPQQDE